jgi:ElaB/YqjD/DUF883 family membrane-anchored ribosome-binding protein
MMTSTNAIDAKRDLHVGGTGARPLAALATVPMLDPLVDASDQVARTAAALAQRADGFIRENPWAAIALVGLAGLAAGYLLSRRV